MGGPRGGRDGRERAEKIEVGTDGAHYEHDHRYDGGRNHHDWTNEPYYDKQFAENYSHGESIFEWGDDGETQDQWENNRKHDPDEFEWTDGRNYQGQYDDMGPSGGRRENGVPSRARGPEAPDPDTQPL